MRTLYTLSPQQLNASPKMSHAVKMDWVRAGKFLAGTYPAPVPAMYLWGDRGADLQSFFDAPFVVIDTEYNYTNDRERPQDRPLALTLVGLYGPGTPVLQAEWNKMLWTEQSAFVVWLRELIGQQVIVFQNTLADVAVLDKFCGIKWEEYHETHDTMYAHSVLWSEMPHSLEFLASIYGRHEKLKHLSQEAPLLYNAGDVLETANAWLGSEREFQADPVSRRVYERFLLPLRPIIYETEQRGIRVNRDIVETVRGELAAKAESATAIGQAYAGYPINLNSSDQIIAAITAEGIKLRSTKADIMVEKRNGFLPVDKNEDLTEGKILERIEDGAHPLLEACAGFVQASTLLSSYITPLFRVDGTIQPRVYPHFLPTAQDNGRWSTTNPPLAQLPEGLRCIVIPDEGYPWVGWDWDAIELRIFAAMARDEMLLGAFDKGWDLHTITFCEMFDVELPPNLMDPHTSPESADWREAIGWAGKDDKRRVFCKTFVYRCIYGGEPKNAHSLPGAKKLGLPGKQLVSAAYRWLGQHPGIDKLWRRFKSGAIERGEVRSFLGRRRKLLERNLERRVRQAYDQPMQAGCSDIYNWVIGEVNRQMPDVGLVFGMHDSLYFRVPLEVLEDRVPRILAIGAETWDVEGYPMRFTLTPKLYWAPEDAHLEGKYKELAVCPT